MNKNMKMGLFFVGGMSFPYFYYIFFRPKLLELEERFDHKVTSISDKELEKMKLKMEEMKGKVKNNEERS